MSEALRRRLVRLAAEPYRRVDLYAWHFARGKLGGDPVFMAMLSDGLLPSDARILDLGCGKGLLASWLSAASRLHASGDWPRDWPAPPRLERYLGIDLDPRDVARARRAVSGAVRVEHGDIREAALERVNLVVILDVLHYIRPMEQREVLARVRESLEPGGRLLLRVGDASAGLPFRASLAVDWLVARLRRQPLASLHCRPLADWIRELRDLGFRAETRPMSSGTPFANHLVVAEP